MTFSRRQRWLAAFVVGVGLLLAWAGLSERKEPKLTITYVGQVATEHYGAEGFAVTNTGTFVIFLCHSGFVQSLGQTNKAEEIPFPTLARLAPGEGEIIPVVKPDGLKVPWRFTCYYTQEGIRTRIWGWLWQKDGLGEQADWLIPPFLRKLPVDRTATSAWIDE